jgi:Starch-binding associating with outer membrane
MKKSILSLVVLGVLFTGCSKKFFDINENPNLPTDQSVTAELVLPYALHETGRIQSTNYGVLAQWMGWWARGGDFGPNVETESFNITTTFGAGTWANWFNNLNDYNVIIKKTSGTDQNFYQAIARTMKTVGFMYLVDTYNNVPYSQAFDLTNFITPKYDKGADIYSDLLKELDKALVLLNSLVPGGDPKISTADIMFKGSVTKWKQFINTQRLRLVLRLSQTTLVVHATELAKVTAEGYLMQGETAQVNPPYVQITNQQNPFWDTYKQSAVGESIDKFNRANNYTLNALRNASDIRYQYYYEPAQTPLNGNIYYGYNFGENLPNSGPYFSNNSSAVAGKGIAKSAGMPQWILTSIESLFMQAEAKQRGYIAGNAETAFYDAIRESFSYLGVTNATTEANNYIASGNQYVNWAGAANKIQLIVTQKYFSSVGLTPFEAWSDYRRTGYPNNIPPTMAANPGPNIPVRYRYPQNEYNFNPANAAGENDPSPFTSKIFWDL